MCKTDLAGLFFFYATVCNYKAFVVIVVLIKVVIIEVSIKTKQKKSNHTKYHYYILKAGCINKMNVTRY